MSWFTGSSSNAMLRAAWVCEKSHCNPCSTGVSCTAIDTYTEAFTVGGQNLFVVPKILPHSPLTCCSKVCEMVDPNGLAAPSITISFTGSYPTASYEPSISYGASGSEVVLYDHVGFISAPLSGGTATITIPTGFEQNGATWNRDGSGFWHLVYDGTSVQTQQPCLNILLTWNVSITAFLFTNPWAGYMYNCGSSTTVSSSGPVTWSGSGTMDGSGFIILDYNLVPQSSGGGANLTLHPSNQVSPGNTNWTMSVSIGGSVVDSWSGTAILAGSAGSFTYSIPFNVADGLWAWKSKIGAWEFTQASPNVAGTSYSYTLTSSVNCSDALGALIDVTPYEPGL